MLEIGLYVGILRLYAWNDKNMCKLQQAQAVHTARRTIRYLNYIREMHGFTILAGRIVNFNIISCLLSAANINETRFFERN